MGCFWWFLADGKYHSTEYLCATNPTSLTSKLCLTEKLDHDLDQEIERKVGTNMRYYTYATESEVISGTSDQVRASKGLGTGFNSHAGTGTIASAAEQRSQVERGEAAFLRTVLTSADIDPAVKQALPLAVITEVLRTLGVSASWSVQGDSGFENVDPRNAIDVLSRSGSTLKVELATDLPAEKVAGLMEELHASCVAHLENIDSLVGAHPGQGRAFYALMAMSSVFTMSVGRKGSALAHLVADAKSAITLAASIPTGSIFAAPAKDLESCPVCNSRTGRTDLVCPKGHRTAAAVRASQEQVVLDAARKAALQAGLILSVQAKTKGAPRFELDATTSPAILATIQDVSAKVSFSSPAAPGDLTAAWFSLDQTSTMRTVLDATMATAAAGVNVRTRVLRAVIDALEKAADVAADVIADPIRSEIANLIVGLEREKSAIAWKIAETEYRKELVGKATTPASPEQLRKFVAETNKSHRFAGHKAPPRAAKGDDRKGPRSKRRGRKAR